MHYPFFKALWVHSKTEWKVHRFSRYVLSVYRPSLLSKYMFFKRLSLQKSKSHLDESRFVLHNTREIKMMVT